MLENAKSWKLKTFVNFSDSDKPFNLSLGVLFVME